MTDQNPAKGQPDFEPPGGNPPVPPPVPPMAPGQPAQPYPTPAQPFPPQGQPYPSPGQPGSYPPFLPPQQRPTTGRGSIWLGVGITVAALLASWGLSAAVPYDNPLASVTNLIAIGLPFALVLGGIVMAAMPRTTRTGAGILIAIGAGILIAGGLCFALVLGFGAFGG